MLLPFLQWSNLLKELTRSTHLHRLWILSDTAKHINSNLLQQSLTIIDLLFEVFQQQQKIIEDSEKAILKGMPQCPSTYKMESSDIISLEPYISCQGC